MSARDPKITLLRAALATTEPLGKRVPLGVPRLDGTLAGGLKCGALHEIFAVPSHEGAAAGFAAGLAIRLGGPLLWIRQDYAGLEFGELAATGLFVLGLDPARVLLLRVPDATGALRAAADALTCAALGAVVIELAGAPKLLDLTAYRRLALGAGVSGVTVLLLRLAAAPGIGGAETRWLVRSVPSVACGGEDGDWGRPAFGVELQRNRHGPAGHWVVEWSCDDGVFRPADRGVAVSTSADRPVAAAMATASAA
jgi:protein ImuA